MEPFTRFPTRLLLTFVAVLLAGCAGQLSKGAFSGGAVPYRVGELPASWERVRMTGNDVTFVSRDSPHSLAVNATCADNSDSALEVLTRHLLMGFTERRTIAQSKVPLDGREALRTQVVAKLDGVPVELVLVVMKKDDCVYDFTYLAPDGRLDERLETFEELLRNFKTGASP